MYSSEITNQFIELRSQNVSLEKIAKTLGINKSTAIDWQTRYKAQIDEIRAFHLEAIRERLATRYEDELEYAMCELKRIRAQLKTRDFDYEPTGFLHHAEAAAYRRVQKLCALADFPSTGRDAAPPASAPDNPTIIQPFPHQSNGGSVSAESQIQNPQSETTGSAVASPSPCGRGIEGDPQPNSILHSELSTLDSEGAQTSSPFPAPPTEEPQPIILSDNHFVNPVLPESKTENPTKIQPFPHQNNGGSVTPPPPKSESEIHTPPPPIETPSSPRLAQLDPDDPNFYGESIVIDPKESARSILERYGVKLPNNKDVRLIRPI